MLKFASELLVGGSGQTAEMLCEAPGRGTDEFAECPKRTCRANVDCWVAYGKPQQCVCDPHFCGLVCLPGKLAGSGASNVK